jgi:hypothetical protein
MIVPSSAAVQSESALAGHQQQISEVPKQCDASSPWNGRSGKSIDTIKECISSKANDVPKQTSVHPQDTNAESAPTTIEHISQAETSIAFEDGLHVPSDDVSSIPIDTLDLFDFDLDENFFQVSPNTAFGHIPSPPGSQVPEVTFVCSENNQVVGPSTGATSTLKRARNNLEKNNVPAARKKKTIGEGDYIFIFPLFF